MINTYTGFFCSECGEEIQFFDDRQLKYCIHYPSRPEPADNYLNNDFPDIMKDLFNR
ncbi:hypothetical protein M0R04_12100 [Candidatus Dojkabacteria bacterium]|jgi:hypothetical protein|nr:hypothetical protein [Candidatus Dojkabacteria bacterium]